MDVETRITDAYGFVGGAGADPAMLVGALASIGGIRFAGRVVGNYDLLIAAHVENLAELQDDVVPRVAKTGARDVEWACAVGPVRALPKRRRTADAAFVRVWTPDAASTLEDLERTFGELNERDGYGFGGAIVTGSADLLVDLGAPTEGEVVGQVFALREIRGVERTETALSSLQHNAYFADGS